MPRKYFSIDDVATFVRHSGPSTLPGHPPVRGAGEALLCLHGAGGSLGLFDGVFDALGDGHDVVAFDQPGHGRSGGLDSLGSVERMAGFTLSLLDALALDAAVLLGHDLGAAVALRCTLMRPEKVRALVLCAAGARYALPDDAVEQARRVSEGKERRPFDPSAFSSKTSPDVMKRAFMEGMKTDPRATYGDLLAGRDWDDTAQLAEVATPVLVIHGEEDFAWVRDGAAELADALPRARLETVPEAGHAILLEQPETLARAVDGFLGGLA